MEKSLFKYKKLSEIAYLLNGYAFKSKNYVENGIRVIRIANVQDGFIVDTCPCYYPQDSDENISLYSLQSGDLLISLTGNVGRVGILTNEFLPAALNQRVGCIRIKDTTQVLLKYLFYFFRCRRFVQDCVKASKGVAQLNLSTKWLNDYRIPISPLPEQERIVARIEELFSQLDNGVETLKKTKQQLAVYRQAVLKEAFDRVRPFCTFETILDVCEEIKVGIVIKPTQYYVASNGVFAFRNANVRRGYIEDNDWIMISEEGHIKNKRSEVHTGDVLIARSGVNLGMASAVPQKYDGYNAIDVVIAVPKKNQLLSNYLAYYTNSPYGINSVKKNQRGVAQGHLNVTVYGKLPIMLPDLNRQMETITEIDSRLSVCDSIEQTIDTALRQADALRQSILKKAFEGKI